MNTLPSFLRFASSLELLSNARFNTTLLRRMTTGGTPAGPAGQNAAGKVIRQPAGMGAPSTASFKPGFAPAQQPPASAGAGPVSRLETLGLSSGAKRAATSNEIPVSTTGQESELAKQVAAIESAPQVPKLLGILGVIPFLGLSPISVSSIGLPQFAESCANLQLSYAAGVVTFLGAVHWGSAMQCTLVGPAAQRAATDRYAWSVVPCLLAAPALCQRPLVTSASLTLALFLCYLQDRGYARTGLLPPWYAAMRGPLTALACLGTASSFVFFLDKEAVKAKKVLEKDVQAMRQESRGGHPQVSQT